MLYMPMKHVYIYIYILLLGPVCHLFSQDFARSWSVAWGGPRDLEGWQRQWYAVGVFFSKYIYIYIGLEPLVWTVQEAFIIYIYTSFVCYTNPAEGSFTAKKWFWHRAGQSPGAHSIGKFFLCYIVLFSSETSAPGWTSNVNFRDVKFLV